MRSESLFWTDNSRQFSVSIEQQTLDKLIAELRSEASPMTTGVLLGTVRRDSDWTRVEVGACLPFRSEPAIELRNYPRATSRAPGCVGYFSIGAVEPSEPTLGFLDDAQVFLFARRSNKGKLCPEVYVSRDGALVPIPPSSRRIWVACAAFAGILLLGGVLAMSRPQIPLATTASERFTIIPKFTESIPFQLAVAREAGSLKLSWDAHAFAIRSAQKGVLTIEDGERNTQQHLDADDLRSGQLVYVPGGSSSNIRFRMDLVSQTGTVESASARVLGLAPKLAPKEVVRTRVATPPVRTQKVSLPEPVPTTIVPTPAPITTLIAPPPIVEFRPIERPPAPSIPTVTPAVADAPARLSITQAAQEPKVKRSVKPSIPLGLQSMLRSRSRTPIVIPVKVSIDRFGQVISAQADYPQGSVFEKQLVNLVQTTAHYWTFDPATINGKPVASELVINFKF